MFSKRNKKLGVVLVWVITIAMILMYVPLVFTPKSENPPTTNQVPTQRQVIVPLTPKISSSSTATSTKN